MDAEAIINEMFPSDDESEVFDDAVVADAETAVVAAPAAAADAAAANAAADAAVAAADADDEDDGEEEDDDDDAIALDPNVSPLQQFVENDANVSPEKRMTYIFMLSHQNVPDFDTRVNHPYSEFIERTGYKRVFKYPKNMIIQEMKRRNPGARLNASNITVERLLGKLTPLENDSDRRYVARKESEYREHFMRQLRQDEAAEMENNEPNGRMRPEDRMRFAIMLATDEDMYEAFLRSQDCLTRVEIDAGQSGAGTEFAEMAVIKLNDDDWVAESEAAPGLHSDFAQRRFFPRGDFVWTVEKVKRYLNDARRNVTEMVRRYELSGNGANQAIHDDSDNEVDNSEENWGRFNADRARRVAERRNDTNDGDDRASFLRHLPVDYLYTWHTLDKYNLLHFTCARLTQDQSASSHDTPVPTSRGGRRANRNNSNDALARNQRDMVTSVQNIGVSIADMSRANAEMGRAAKIRRIDELRAQRYKVALAMATAASPAEENVHQYYINELTQEIDSGVREVRDDETATASNGT